MTRQTPSQRLPADLLDRPAEEAARLVALEEVTRAESARAALARGDDPEALHDFRVALRRLRSHLRAFRDPLDAAVGRKLRRRLGRLADATNPARDAEVGIELLDGLDGDAGALERRAAAALRARLAERRDRAYRDASGAALDRFDRLAGRLRQRLSSWMVEVRLDGDSSRPRPFRSALGDELALHADALLGALESVASDADEGPAHRARIEAKRLRYLLEPVTDRIDAAREPVRRLRELQDLLGRGNDLAVLAAELAAEAADAERAHVDAAARGRRARRPGGRSGRTALARRIAARRAALWREFEGRWLAPDATETAALSSAIAGLVESLAEPPEAGATTGETRA